MSLIERYFEGPWPKYFLAFIFGLAGGRFTEYGELCSDAIAFTTVALICVAIIISRKALGEDNNEY